MLWILIKRAFYYILGICIVVAAIDVVLVLGFAHAQPEVQKSDAIIVLGAAINSNAAYNRALQGLHLYEAGKAPVIVVSGGKVADPDISEAQYMRKVITKNSTQSPVVILEDKSGNTYENIRNSRAKLPDAQSVIIVSDSFHLARGVLLAKKFGFKDVSWSSPDEDYYSAQELRYYYLREMIALVGYVPKFIK